MKIKLAEHFGICFGVRDAIKQAEALAKHAPLTILGELVHNPVVRDQLKQLGVQEGRLEHVSSAKTQHVMITAHGTSEASRERWRRAGFSVSDGTCPLVRHAHEQLRQLVAIGYFPIVIGQRGHVEVLGFTGDFPQSHVIEISQHIADLPEHQRYAVICQTTQPLEKVEELVREIRAARPQAEVRFCDTACQPTKNRQNAVKKLIEETDVIVVVGGRNSNNTRQLVETVRKADRRVYHIERPDEIDARWFDAAATVGVTAGTSTLKETVHAVFNRLLQIAAEKP